MNFAFYGHRPNSDESLPHFANEGDSYRLFDPQISIRTNRKVTNPVLKHISSSISKNLDELFRMRENDEQLILEFSETITRLDDLVQASKPKPRHLKNVLKQPTTSNTRQSKSPAPRLHQVLDPKPVLQNSNPHNSKHSPLIPKPQTNLIPQPNQTAQFPTIPQQLKFENIDPRQHQHQQQQYYQHPQQQRVPTIEAEYVSMSGIQEANSNNYRESQYSENYMDSELKRIDSFSPLESYHEHNNIMFSTEQQENKSPNPYSSLEEKLSSLISERKALERQTKFIDVTKKPTHLKK